jgi:HAD superfamily hydrolase (TIGR01549 family)
MARPPYRVSHVIFDVDGTLVDWEHSYEAALLAASEELSGRLGRPVSPTALRQARELVVAEPVWSRRMLRAIREESIRRVLVAAGAFTEETHAAVVGTYFRARDEALFAFDDVEPVFEELAGRGFSLIAATNGNAALDRFELFRHLDHMHIAEREGVSKPQPAFFTGLLERVGGVPELAISIGDSIENDVEPPRRLGMHALFIDRGGRAPEAGVPRIESLVELPALLELAMD